MKTQSEKLKELFPEPGMTAEEKERLRWKRAHAGRGTPGLAISYIFEVH